MWAPVAQTSPLPTAGAAGGGGGRRCSYKDKRSVWGLDWREGTFGEACSGKHCGDWSLSTYQQQMRMVGPPKSESWSEAVMGRQRNSSFSGRWGEDLAVQLLFPPLGAGTAYPDVLIDHYTT